MLITCLNIAGFSLANIPEITDIQGIKLNKRDSDILGIPSNKIQK